MATERLLVLMGSGETTPTMVTTHQRIFGRIGSDAEAVLVDTPYGFQENADDITARTVGYFDRNVGHRVEPVSLRRPQQLSGLELEQRLAALREADWIFAGPGSPTYLLRQWLGTPIVETVGSHLRTGGALVFASAAAVTVGRHAIPVYEIYKAGFEPHWLDGLDLLSHIGLDVVVIPHYDNAEGGTHDTRFCYLGERRLARLEEKLDPSTWVLGVDEHTACTIDLATGDVMVEGRGGVTVRVRGESITYPAGTTTSLEALVRAAEGTPDAAAQRVPADTGGASPAALSDAAGDATPSGSPLNDAVDRLERTFDKALADEDMSEATAAALELEETIRAWSADTETANDLDRAITVLRSMITRLGALAEAATHDHRKLVEPHVQTLLHLREQARSEGRYDEADHIRDHLVEDGVEVRDTADGTRWEWDEPAIR